MQLETTLVARRHPGLRPAGTPPRRDGLRRRGHAGGRPRPVPPADAHRRAHESACKFGTGVAIAFPRSPMVTAQIAWDLQRYSGGRFILGLGTQVKGHNERRYSTAWPSPPGPRLTRVHPHAEGDLQDIPDERPPRLTRGPHYQFTLISPFFNPGANREGHVPIYISAVNRYNCRLVGEALRRHPHARLQHGEVHERGDHPGDRGRREEVRPQALRYRRRRRRVHHHRQERGGGRAREGPRPPAAIFLRLHPRLPPRPRGPRLAGRRPAAFPPLDGGQVGGDGDRPSQTKCSRSSPSSAPTTRLVPKIKERYAGHVTTLDFGFGVRSPEDHEAPRVHRPGTEEGVVPTVEPQYLDLPGCPHRLPRLGRRGPAHRPPARPRLQLAASGTGPRRSSPSTLA